MQSHVQSRLIRSATARPHLQSRSTRICLSCSTQQAVVIGSGIAGLTAAKMLSKHFPRVLLLERDTPVWLEQEDAAAVAAVKGVRRGVTQYNQLHGLLSQGVKALQGIFEGQFVPAYKQAGGNLVDIFTTFTYIHPVSGVWPLNHAAKEPALCGLSSRHLLEGTIRKLVGAVDNVEVQYGVRATGLVFQEAGGESPAVRGVLLADGSSVPAALVVDCSGRYSKVAEWLALQGYQRPRESKATANCGYVGFLLELAPETEALLQGVSGLYVMPDAPDATRFSVMWRVEGGRWMACLGGQEGQHPPLKDDHLMDFAETVWHPAAAKVLAGCSQVAPATRFYGIGSHWRHYEEAVLPEGLVLLADSICSFNPIYGQGITVAALEVAELGKLLMQRKETHTVHTQTALAMGPAGSSSSSSNASNNSTSSADTAWLHGLPLEAQQAFVPIISHAWGMAVGSDMKFASAVSNESGSAVSRAVDKVMQAYLSSVCSAAAVDCMVNEAMVRVMHMMDGPDLLMQPAILTRVLAHQLTAVLPWLLPVKQQLYPTEASSFRSCPALAQLGVMAGAGAPSTAAGSASRAVSAGAGAAAGGVAGRLVASAVAIGGDVSGARLQK